LKLHLPFQGTDDSSSNSFVRECYHRHNRSYVLAILQCVLSKPSKPPSSNLESKNYDDKVAQASAELLRNLCTANVSPELRIILGNYDHAAYESLPSFETRKS
jgi:hypothetical protein